MQQNTYNHLTIPAAIVIAGAIIAIAIIWSKQPAPITDTVKGTDSVSVNLAPITSTDHIFGNPNAPIRIVEYSDPSCPYCKAFNTTMEQVIGQYGPSGNVAWVYRHFPLDKPNSSGQILHPNANNESQALECAAEVGGNDKFWAFEKKLYETTPGVTNATPKGLDQAELPIIAKSVDIDVTKFTQCLSSGKFKEAVEKQYLTGVNAGVTGTPSNFLVLSKPAVKGVDDFINNTILSYRLPQNILYISDDRKIIVMSGAMPKELISGLIGAIQGIHATSSTPTVN